MQHDERWVPSLDGVRGICATGILVFHCWAYLAVHLDPGGVVAKLWFVTPQGLTAFFVLSGFLLYRPYVEAALGRRPFPRTRTMWWRRFLRVYPGHAVVFVLAAVVLPLGLLEVGTEHGRPGPAGVAANLLLVQGYSPGLVLSGLGASWSLVAEVAFYLLLPVLGWVAVRAVAAGMGIPGTLLTVVPMLVGGWLVRDYAWTQSQQAGGGELGDWTPVLFYSFPASMDLIAAGMLGAVVAAVAAPAWRVRLGWGLVGVGLAAVAVVPLGIPGNTLVALGCAGLYVLLAAPSGAAAAVVSRFLALRPLAFLGRISYASYLWHLPVIFGLQRWAGPFGEVTPAGAAGLTAAVLATSWTLAWLTTVAVVEPAIRLAHRRRHQPATADAVVAP